MKPQPDARARENIRPTRKQGNLSSVGQDCILSIPEQRQNHQQGIFPFSSTLPETPTSRRDRIASCPTVEPGSNPSLAGITNHVSMNESMIRMSKESSRQAFIDTILAEPEIESHRLIFADWLEENGDLPKAEGLRTLPGLAGVWSSDWGNDQFGMWCAFAIKGVSQKMRWIAPGTFWMGSPADEEGRDEDEGPRHPVELTQGFWMADTPCTQEMWTAVMGENPSEFQDVRRAVEKVDFADCHAFFDKVSTLIRGLELVLPTEAQWECACRAGTEGSRYSDDLDAIAWYEDNSGEETHPVGEKDPNAWGLYDMLGNVWEWCEDGMREYLDEKVIDPIGPTEEAAYRVIRGGGWNDSARSVRAAYRLDFHHPDYRFNLLGFRCSSSG